MSNDDGRCLSERAERFRLALQGDYCGCGACEEQLSAVLAVADAEQAELRAEVERLTKARDAWQRSAKGARREFVETHDLLEAAERALADERVKVARASAAVAATWVAGVDGGTTVPSLLRIIEAALAGPEPEAKETT